jgi:hypothetical protein
VGLYIAVHRDAGVSLRVVLCFDVAVCTIWWRVEYITSHNVIPLQGSIIIETARFGSRIRYVQRLYAVNGKLEDYEAPERYNIIQDGQLRICDDVIFCAVPRCEFAWLYDTHQHFYEENHEHFNPANYHFPENALALLPQTCYYAID